MISGYRLFALVGALSILGACDLYRETNLTQNRIQVEKEQFAEEMPVTDMNDAYIQALGRHYHRHGDGVVDLTVTYDPKSKTDTAMKASNEAARLVSVFRSNGMNHVNANILPTHGKGGLAVVSYTSYNALPPKDCGLMSGMDDSEVKFEEDYKLGCTVETVFARQIARPKDLKGQHQTDPTSEGRIATNVVDQYRFGAPNEPLEGESASGGN